MKYNTTFIFGAGADINHFQNGQRRQVLPTGGFVLFDVFKTLSNLKTDKIYKKLEEKLKAKYAVGTYLFRWKDYVKPMLRSRLIEFKTSGLKGNQNIEIELEHKNYQIDKDLVLMLSLRNGNVLAKFAAALLVNVFLGGNLSGN